MNVKRMRFFCGVFSFLFLGVGGFVFAQSPVIVDDELDLLEDEVPTNSIRSTNSVNATNSMVSTEVFVPLDEFEETFGTFYLSLEKEYGRRFPLPEVGEKMAIVKPSGIVDSGVYQGVSDGVVELKHGEFDKRIPFNQLRVQDRLRLDAAFRKVWLDVFSRLETRRHYRDLSVVFETYNLALKKSFAKALAVSDPAALYRMAKEYRSGLKRKKDVGYSFLYTSAAAKLGALDAQYDLGRMYFSGIGTSASRRVGLQWIATAAKEGHGYATKFLERHKVSREAAKKAVEAQQELSREEQEAYEARLEYYQKVNESRKITRGKKRGDPFNK